MRLLPAGLATLIFVLPSAAWAHNDFEVDAAVGYRFGGGLDVDVDGEEGRLWLDGGPSITAILGYRIQHDGFIYINYSRQGTTLNYRADGAETSDDAGLSTEYIQFGGNLEITRGRWVPYLGASVGASRFARTGDGGGDKWAFAAVLDGGVKFEVTEWFHLRLIGRLPFSFIGGESSALCVVPGGCVIKLDGMPIVQGEFDLGLGFSF